jgi:predicted HTH domain antitoxin
VSLLDNVTYKHPPKEKMSMVISDEILDAAHMTETEFLQEIAILLYEKGKLSLGKASKLARMGRIQFQLLLASRQIPINYGIEDFETDLKTLRQKSRFLA